MKLQALAEKTNSILPLLRCPLCGEAFSLRDTQSLVCKNNHCYDLSRKGYINLAPSHGQQADKYSAALFEARHKIFAEGFYAPVMQAIGDAVEAHAPAGAPFSLLDAGCGEGSYAHALARRFPQANVIGLDLNRDAVTAAARLPGPAHWLVGNLGRLPIANGCLSFLLDVLTPADYGEFSRVLAPGGILLKVVPGQSYLSEIRNCLRQELRSGDYENHRVLSHLQKHACLLEQKTLCHTYPVTPEQGALFARMTPMTFGLSPEALESIHISAITIHLELMVCRMGRNA